MSKRRCAVRTSTASSSQVRRSTKSVPNPALVEPSRDHGFRGLCRLLPLPCANTTRPGASPASRRRASSSTFFALATTGSSSSTARGSSRRTGATSQLRIRRPSSRSSAVSRSGSGVEEAIARGALPPESGGRILHELAAEHAAAARLGQAVASPDPEPWMTRVIDLSALRASGDVVQERVLDDYEAVIP